MNTPETNFQPEQKVTISNIYRRTAGVVLTPRKTLIKTAFEPGGWVPILVVSVALAIIRLILLPDIIEQYNNPEVLQKYAQDRKLTVEVASRELEALKRNAPIMTILETPFLVAAGISVIALFVYLMGKIIYRKTIAYVAIFRVISWASIVSTIPLILSVPLKLINPDWELPTNAAIFLPVELIGKYYFNILKTLDIFLVWQVWLISIGVSSLYSIPFQKAVTTIGTMFLMFVILNALTFSVLP